VKKISQPDEWFFKMMKAVLCIWTVLAEICAAVRHRRKDASARNALGDSAEVFVMLPLTTVSNEGVVSNRDHFSWQLDRLKEAGIDGVMADVWWGLTEKSSKQYDFSGYEELVSMVEQRGMRVQFVASFHQCGGNVGDTCFIPLPDFVLQNQDIWYTDQSGNTNKEYISLFADHVRLNDGRTPLEMYEDWFSALYSTFKPKIDSGVVMEVQVGMGPAGELRYPGYYSAHGWSYPGIGQFQVWDKHARASWKASVPKGLGWIEPPSDAGWTNSKPWDTPFFTEGYRWGYGEIFLDWYFSKLKQHGYNVLSKATSVFGNKLILAGKVACIHWWYGHPSHAAELTSGYYNTNGRDAYGEIADVFKSVNATLDFTCLEMRDFEMDNVNAFNSPEGLVNQVRSAAIYRGVMFNGENALPTYDWPGYEQILTSRWALHAFTYRRLTDTLVQGGFDAFRGFVWEMHKR